jgi:hypothetical protein
MAAAFPVISAGVGIAGGIVGMFERRAEERRQEQLVMAQLNANQRAQEMQYSAIMQGQQLQAQQYMQENAMRLQQFNQAVFQHQTAAMQNEGQYANTTSQLGTALTGAQNEFLAGNSQAVSREAQYNTAANQSRFQGYQDSMAVDQQTMEMYQALQEAMTRGDSEFANFLSRTLANETGPQVSDSTVARARQQDQQEYGRLLQTLTNAEAMDEAQMQQLLLSEEFANLLEDIGVFEGNQIRQKYNYAIGTLANDINTKQAVNEWNYRTIAEAIRDSLEMQPINAQIDQLQGNMNFAAKNSELIGQAGGIAARGLGEQAQLLRSLPPRQSLLGGILNTVSAAAPLASLFMNSPSSGFISRRSSYQEPLNLDLSRSVYSSYPLNIDLARPLY